MEGHHYGPSSPQRRDALRAVDTIFQHMTQWIQVTRNKGPRADLPSRHSPSVSSTVTPLSAFSPSLTHAFQVPGDPLFYRQASGREMTQTRVISQLGWRDGPVPVRT